MNGLERKLKFIVVGGVNTLIGYGLFALVYYIASGEVHYLWIGTVSHVLSASVAFLTHRTFVFHSSAPLFPEFVRCQIAYAALLPVGLGLLFLFHEIAGLPVLAAQAMAIVCSVVLNYLANAKFIFRTNA